MKEDLAFYVQKWWAYSTLLYKPAETLGRTIQWKPVSWCFLNKNKNVPENN